MAEYIDRDKTIAEIDDCFPANPTSEFSKGVAVGRAIAKVAVNHTPAADVRPVVLCKDCRHRDPEDHKCDCGGTERQGCPFKVADDYFCAYGER